MGNAKFIDITDLGCYTITLEEDNGVYEIVTKKDNKVVAVSMPFFLLQDAYDYFNIKLEELPKKVVIENLG